LPCTFVHAHCKCSARQCQHAPLALNYSAHWLLLLTCAGARAVGIQAPGLCAGAQQAAARGREPQVRGRPGLPALRGAQRCGRPPAPRRLAAGQARRPSREQGACGRRCRAPRPGAWRLIALRAHSGAGLRNPGRQRLQRTAPVSRPCSWCLRNSAPHAPGPALRLRMRALGRRAATAPPARGAAPCVSPLEPCRFLPCARAGRAARGGRRGHALPRGVPGRRGV